MFEVLNFNKFSDGRGDLVPIELGTNFEKSFIPFDVKRIYFISTSSNDRDTVRGKHAHIDLEQVMICAQGSFVLDLEDSKGNKESFLMNDNNKGIHIKKGLVWRELKSFSPNCVVLVLASNHYIDSDYIRTYSEFKDKCKI